MGQKSSVNSCADIIVYNLPAMLLLTELASMPHTRGRGGYERKRFSVGARHYPSIQLKSVLLLALDITKHITPKCFSLDAKYYRAIQLKSV